MADSDRKDTYGYLGCEPTTLKELLGCITDAAEKIAKNEGQAARTRIEEGVRQRPFLSLAIAAAAGFLLGSLRRH